MELMKFYVLATPKPDTPEDLLGGIRAIREEGFRTGEAVRCPRCNRPLSMLKWLPPFRIELESWGKEYGDFADLGEELIVSERFAQAFQRSGLHGLSVFEPVEVVKVIHHLERPKEPLPRYFTATVTLSPTTVDQHASGYVWADESKVCPICLWDNLKRFKRIVIKEETWNGDDIFFPRGGTRLMVSERFKSLCEQEDFQGVVFKAPDQESYDYFPWETQGSSQQ
jgi:hypothetical protein